MEFSLANLIDAIRFTLQSPRQGARAVMDLRLSVSTGWTALMLAAVVSTLLLSASLMLVPVEMPAKMAAFYGNPLQLVVLQAAVMTFGALLIYGVGKRFGGTGSLAATLAVTNWLQAILLVLQVLQLVAMLIAPLLADLIGVAGAVLSVWLLAQFVAELHGFASAWRVLGAMFATIFALAFALTMVLAILGVAVHV